MDNTILSLDHFEEIKLMMNEMIISNQEIVESSRKLQEHHEEKMKNSKKE